jgi:hypothetical protein
MGGETGWVRGKGRKRNRTGNKSAATKVERNLWEKNQKKERKEGWAGRGEDQLNV